MRASKLFSSIWGFFLKTRFYPIQRVMKITSCFVLAFLLITDTSNVQQSNRLVAIRCVFFHRSGVHCFLVSIWKQIRRVLDGRTEHGIIETRSAGGGFAMWALSCDILTGGVAAQLNVEPDVSALSPDPWSLHFVKTVPMFCTLRQKLAAHLTQTQQVRVWQAAGPFGFSPFLFFLFLSISAQPPKTPIAMIVIHLSIISNLLNSFCQLLVLSGS